MRYNELGLAVEEEPSADQIRQLADMARAELSQGWIGVDFEPEYAPGTTSRRCWRVANVAAEFGVPCFFHGRYSAVGTNAQTLDEIIEIAKQSGAAVHVEHIISTGGTFDMAGSLARVEKARADGHDVSACMYPYNYWATYIQSTRFSDGWQERFRISYGDLQVAGTTERLTEGTFDALRGGGPDDNKLTAAFAIPEADVDTCIQAPWVMIGSDAILTDGNNHPRATGCFARTLGLLRPGEGPHLVAGGARQDDDPPGPPARGQGAGAAQEGPAPTGRRRRHHDLRPRPGDRPVDGGGARGGLGRHRVRAHRRPGGEVARRHRRHQELGRPITAEL